MIKIKEIVEMKTIMNTNAWIEIGKFHVRKLIKKHLAETKSTLDIPVIRLCQMKIAKSMFNAHQSW